MGSVGGNSSLFIDYDFEDLVLGAETFTNIGLTHTLLRHDLSGFAKILPIHDSGPATVGLAILGDVAMSHFFGGDEIRTFNLVSMLLLRVSAVSDGLCGQDKSQEGGEESSDMHTRVGEGGIANCR